MTWTFERRLLAAALVAWGIVAALNLVLGPPLGHDEAAFAVVARGDGPIWLYRSRGVVALARLGLALGGADWQLRLVSAIAGLGVVLAVHAVGRAVFDARAGAWAAAVIATAHPMLLRNAQLLGDLPATAAMLAGIAVLVTELDRPDGPRWRIVLVAPAFAAAFYARYGSAPVIALTGLAAAALWWRSIRARPLPVLAAAALFALALIPHALHSLRWTRELLGVLRSSAGQPRRAFIGEGLVTYLTSNPLAYYGVLVAPVMAAGLVGLARTFRRRGPWFLGCVAIGQLVALGLASHGQPRYVFLAVALLVVLGVQTLRALARPRAALALIGTAWLVAAIALAASSLHIARTRSAILAATAAITADRQGRPCMILAGLAPQLMWYSRCQGTRLDELVPDALAPERARYLVSMPYAPVDGPAFAAARGVTLRELATGDERAKVWAIQ